LCPELLTVRLPKVKRQIRPKEKANRQGMGKALSTDISKKLAAPFLADVRFLVLKFPGATEQDPTRGWLLSGIT
jgi:hypothetical protein